MKTNTSGAEFSVLTDREQESVVGGDGVLASTLGWFVGYAVGTVQQALLVDYKLLTNQPLAYVEGKGFI